MKRTRMNYLTSLLLLVVGFMGFQSCDKNNKPQPPIVEETLSITPKEASIKMGESLTIKVLLGQKEVTSQAAFSTIPADIISISKGGKITALKEGKATLKATYNGKEAEATITVTKKEEDGPQEEFMLPYLRWFDSAEELIAFETARGNIPAEKDESMQYYSFQTKSKKMPVIKYIVGQSIQIDLTPEVAQSEELKSFLEKNGFIYGSNDWTPKFMNLMTDKYKTVTGFIYVEYPGVGTFLGFNLKEPTFETLPFPLLDWNASEDAIKNFEEKAGRKYLEQRIDELGRKEIIYGSQKLGEEYEEMFIARYLMKEGKLVKVLLQVTPANYIIKPAGEGFGIMGAFDTYVKGLGYTISKTGDKKNLYSHAEKGNKFTLGQWTIKMKDGRKRIFASMNFVPLDGPNVID